MQPDTIKTGINIDMYQASGANSVKTQTNDLIVFNNKGTRIFWGVFSAFGVFFVYMILILGIPELWARLLFACVGALFGLIGVCGCLTDVTVTIDKKSQSVVIQKNYLIKRSESVTEIPFSHIKEIKITSSSDEGSLVWEVKLILYNYRPFYIRNYTTNSEADAKAVAWRIHNITGKEIIEKHE